MSLQHSSPMLSKAQSHEGTLGPFHSIILPRLTVAKHVEGARRTTLSTVPPPFCVGFCALERLHLVACRLFFLLVCSSLWLARDIGHDAHICKIWSYHEKNVVFCKEHSGAMCTWNRIYWLLCPQHQKLDPYPRTRFKPSQFFLNLTNISL